MAATATIRELRNQFPRVSKLLDEEDEVIVTERGKPKYRLVRYSPPARKKAAAPKDYLKRLRRHQPDALTPEAAKALDEENRGGR